MVIPLAVLEQRAWMRLALKNLSGRKAYSAIIITAVAVAVAMTLLALSLTSGVQRELEKNLQRLGPDLAVAPTGCKERGQIYLSKGPPAQGGIPAETLERLGAFPEIEDAAPQMRLGLAEVGNVQAMLLGYDPANDFVVKPWLDQRETFPGRAEGLVLGAKVPAEGLAAVFPAAAGFSISGRLLPTGSYLDASIFIPRPAAEIAADPVWILLRLRQGTSLDILANRLEVNLDQIEILRRPEMFKTINDQLAGLLTGGGGRAAALLTIAGALLVTGAIFALMTQERKREFGLLKAMGARNALIFKLIMAEAALLGCAGAALGLGLAAAGLWGLSAGLAEEAPAAAGPGHLFAALALAIAVAVLTALYPALGATRLEPYAAIRGGE